MSAAALLPPDFARRSCVLPLRVEHGELVVAVGIRQAGNIELKDDLGRMANRRVRFAIANRVRDRDQDRPVLPGRGRAGRPHLRPDGGRGGGPLEVKEVFDDAPIVKFVNLLITQAIQDRASDIHIEPAEHDLRVRYRIDGVLHEVMRSPKVDPVRGDLPAEDHGRHQHRRAAGPAGRPAVGDRTTARKVDLRVATLPTVWGEKVVMRILDNSTATAGPVRPRLHRRPTTTATRPASPSRTG